MENKNNFIPLEDKKLALDCCPNSKGITFECFVPPVCTERWNNDDWIKWIDSNGKFYYDKKLITKGV